MNDAQDLISKLCTLAGMIMEDTVDVAIVGSGTVEPRDRIRAIADAASNVQILAAAADVVLARSSTYG